MAERRGKFLIDTAQGYALLGDDNLATQTLLRAEQTAPEEVRFNPNVHQVMTTLLGGNAAAPHPAFGSWAARIGVLG